MSPSEGAKSPELERWGWGPNVLIEERAPRVGVGAPRALSDVGG